MGCRLPEWLYEDGIGETRAALVYDGRVVRALILTDDAGAQPGAVMAGRLIERLASGAGRAESDAGPLWLPRVPAGLALGARVRLEITREAIPEPGRAKLPHAAVTEDAPRPAPTLRARIAATGDPVRALAAHQPDDLEAAGWSELLAEAADGEIAFPGGVLRMTPTPAMTLFDVDGEGVGEALAIAAARAAAQAIIRHGIGGAIGIDFPTLAGKAARQAVAAAIDAHLPPPFERTTVNGFGFLQIIRPRRYASLPERLRADPLAAETRAYLRERERTPPGAPVMPIPRRYAAVLGRRPDWLAELTRRTGVIATVEER